jgi:glycosyltransferase involved in cell wall biosynthesis
LIDIPLVSAVIPTYNSSSTLEACLGSIRAQTYSNIEIVVVDNFSTDGTTDIARKYNSEILRVRASRSTARNHGARRARGRFLFFVDADMELTANVMEECVRKSTDRVAAVMIPEIRVGEGFWARCRALERLTYIGNPLIESARFLRRDVFEEAGGYDEKLEAGEDWDLHARVVDLGYEVQSVRALMRHHDDRVALRSLVLKRYRYGKTLLKYIRKHPTRARLQLTPIRPDFVRNWRILAKDPLHAAGMLAMKSVEYVVTAIAILSG